MQLFDDQLLGAVKDEDCCTSLICLSGMKRTYGKNWRGRGKNRNVGSKKIRTEKDGKILKSEKKRREE